MVLADARAGIIGGAAWAVVVAAVGLLVTLVATGGKVPAWTLPAATLLVGAPCAVLVGACRRRAERIAGERDEARRTAEALEGQLHNALAQQGGERPLSNRGQAFVRQIRALRDRNANADFPPQTAELQVLSALIAEMVEHIGRGRTLGAISEQWRLRNGNRTEFLTTLDQLEAIAVNAGIEEAHRARSSWTD